MGLEFTRLFEKGIMSTETIRVGIIGTGSRGITCIGRQIAEQTRELNMSITAFCYRTASCIHIALDGLNGFAANAGYEPFGPRSYADPLGLINYY